MSEYQSIARKFRPLTFADVLGQDPVVQTLKNAIALEKTSHAYIFCGCRGTGKTSLARIFAKALNCQSLSKAGEPCNTCESCLEITKGSSLDVIEIDGASNRGIDDIRKLNEGLRFATFRGHYRIYIIDEVHMLTKEAFNALLKTLEEPPQKVKFLLATTEPHKVLPTILSRCQRFDLKRIPEELIVGKLQNIAKELSIEVENDVYTLVANLAEGSLRDAETLFDRILVTSTSPVTLEKASSIFSILPHDMFAKLHQIFESQEIGEVFSLAETFFSSGYDMNYILDALTLHFRNLLYAFYTPLDKCPLLATEKKVIALGLKIYTKDQLFLILDFLTSTKSKMHQVELSKVELEMILLHIVQTKHRVTVDQIVHSLKKFKQPSFKPELPVAKPQEKVIFDSSATHREPNAKEITPPSNPPSSGPKIETAAVSAEPAPTFVQKDMLEEKVAPKPKAVTASVAVKLEEVETITSDLHVRFETLMRFAAVELGGTLKKHH